MAYLDDAQYEPNDPSKDSSKTPVSQGYLNQQAALQQQMQSHQDAQQQQAPAPSAFGQNENSAPAAQIPSAPTGMQAGSPPPSSDQGEPQQQGQLPANVNPTPTGTNTPGKIVTAGMGSMGAPNPNAPPPGTYGTTPATTSHSPSGAIDPSTQSGIFQGGYAKGILMAAGLISQRDANNRANETQSFQRQMFTKEQQIQEGMQQAGQSGGFEGVLSYLQSADPTKALAFQDAKGKLDNQMLQNTHLSMLNDQQKSNALFQGYAEIGKIGATILQAPPAERNAMYQRMLPAINAVVPNAPSSLNEDAQNMLTLGMGQALPSSMYGAKQRQSMVANTDLAKLNQDIANGNSQGKTAQNDAGQAALLAQRDQYNNKALLANNAVTELDTRNSLAQAQAAKTKQDQMNATQNEVSKFQSQYDKQSSQFTDFNKNFKVFQGALGEAQNGNAAAQTALGTAAALMIGPKRLNPGVLANLYNSDNKAEGFIKDLQSRISQQGNLVMKPSEIGRLNGLVNNIHQQYGAEQDNINKTTMDVANRTHPAGTIGQNDPGLSANINWHNTSIPTPYTAADIDAAAKAAIAGGAPAAIVNSRANAEKAKIGAQ